MKIKIIYSDVTKTIPVHFESSKSIVEHTSKKPKSKFTKTWPFFAVIIFSALLAFSGLKIFQWANDDQSNRTQQAEAIEAASVQEVDTEGELINPPEEQDDDYWYYAKMPFYQVDFGELMAKNSDTVAFIHLNDSYVNYPVVQTADNDYYLTHASSSSAALTGSSRHKKQYFCRICINPS